MRRNRRYAMRVFGAMLVVVAGAGFPASGQRLPADPARRPAPDPFDRLDAGTVNRGLREALTLGASHVIGALGAYDGFAMRPDARIRLPHALEPMRQQIAGAGGEGLARDLEARLNRAAEAALARARPRLVFAFETLTFDSPWRILAGQRDEATRYARLHLGATIEGTLAPVVEQELNAAGAQRALADMLDRYRARDARPVLAPDLRAHVVAQVVAAFFLYLGREEAAIRDFPSRRNTALLQRVFGRR